MAMAFMPLAPTAYTYSSLSRRGLLAPYIDRDRGTQLMIDEKYLVESILI